MPDPDIAYFRQRLARDISRMFRAIERKGSFNERDVKEMLRSTKKTRWQIEFLEYADSLHKTS